MQWHYQRDGSSLGPVDDDELRRLAEAGEIDEDTPVMTDGMMTWERFGSLKLAKPVESAELGEPEPAAQLWYCSQCGERFSASQSLGFGYMVVCASCKPLYVHRLKEGANLVGGLQLAGVGARAAARIIDFIIAYVLQIATSLPMILLVPTLGERGEFSSLSIVVLMFSYFMQIAAPLLYELIFLGRWGATVGKMLLGIKVVRGDQGKLTWGRATGRAFAHMLTGCTVLIGYLIAFFDQERRALHDMICNTRVVRSR